MVDYRQMFDIGIVCTLYEEARAVLDVFSQQGACSFTKAYYGPNYYQYQFTTIQNCQGESLSVLVTWLPETGPIGVAIEIKSLVQRFHFRFIAMSGICTGDKRKVELGDLIVAEYAYFYQTAAIIVGLDGQEHQQQPGIKTVGPTSQDVIRYAQDFNGWKESMREMKSNELHRQLEPDEEPWCFVAPVISEMPIPTDDPFLWLREKLNHKIIALDGTAASFYQMLHDFPDTHSLVVKCVCGYAGMSTNDAYHDYAARASALYLLRFIQDYITEQTIPKKSSSPNGESQEASKKKTSLKIFFCYARKDKVLREKLEEHLEPLRRSGKIRTWHDQEIRPGREWEKEIDKHLNSSDIVLLLISSSFMRSDYCYGKEMSRALERHDAGETRVIPVILRPVDWKRTRIGKLQALPKDGKPITSWRDSDSAFENVIQGIHEVVNELLSQQSSE